MAFRRWQDVTAVAKAEKENLAKGLSILHYNGRRGAWRAWMSFVEKQIQDSAHLGVAMQNFSLKRLKLAYRQLQKWAEFTLNEAAGATVATKTLKNLQLASFLDGWSEWAGHKMKAQRNKDIALAGFKNFYLLRAVTTWLTRHRDTLDYIGAEREWAECHHCVAMDVQRQMVIERLSRLDINEKLKQETQDELETRLAAGVLPFCKNGCGAVPVAEYVTMLIDDVRNAQRDELLQEAVEMYNALIQKVGPFYRSDIIDDMHGDTELLHNMGHGEPVGSTISLEAWTGFFIKSHEAFDSETGKGDSWLRCMLQTLTRNIFGMKHRINIATTEVTQSRLTKEATAAYDLLTLEGPSMALMLNEEGVPEYNYVVTEEDLVDTVGDASLLPDLTDEEADGITMTEWHQYIKESAAKKGHHGTEWMQVVMHNMSGRLVASDGIEVPQTSTSTSKAAQLVERYKKEQHEVFELIAAAGGDVTTMRRQDLVRAHKGDFGMWDRMDADESGEVTHSEWRDCLIRICEEKGEAKAEKWLSSLLATLQKNCIYIDAEHAEAAHEVFKLVSSAGGDMDSMRKEDFVKAKGDPDFFDMMDTDEDGVAVVSEWYSFLTAQSAGRGESGNKWLGEYLAELKKQVLTFVDENEQNATEVFHLLAEEGGDMFTIRKEDLVRAHKGDFKIYEAMDGDADGSVTIAEWRDWLWATRDKKGPGKGPKWLKQLLTTLRTNLKDGVREGKQAPHWNTGA